MNGAGLQWVDELFVRNERVSVLARTHAGKRLCLVAVGAVMAAYNWPRNHQRYQKVERFVKLFFSNFGTLLDPPYHPKWHEVDLRNEVPGWRRFGPAQEWLAANK